MVFPIVALVVVAACGAPKNVDPVPVPAPTAQTECASTIAKVIGLIHAGDAEVGSNLRAVLVNRCAEDKWSVEAQRCMTASTDAHGVHACAEKQLSTEQFERAERAASAILKSEAGGDRLKLSAVEPAKGDTDGGTYVRIMGHRFIKDGPRHVKVYFGSKQGAVVRFQSDSELIVQAPGGKPDETVDVLVIFDPGGQLTLKRAFTFVDRNDTGPTVNDLDQSDASRAVAKMGAFMAQMCACKDRPCADKVNEELTKWGTEMAKTAGRSGKHEKPDPALAKKSAEIMTRYTECLTKAMMAGRP